MSVAPLPAVDVAVEVLVEEDVATAVCVAVPVDVEVDPGGTVLLAVAVLVGVADGPLVAVLVAVDDGPVVAVLVGVAVAVGVGVLEGVAVTVAVDVAVGPPNPKIVTGPRTSATLLNTTSRNSYVPLVPSVLGSGTLHDPLASGVPLGSEAAPQVSV